MMAKLPREHWQTKLGFILAAAGSAIGLGNFWRFSYLAGVSGGGVFILTYLLAVLLMGLPIMLGEFLIGRRAQAGIATAYRKLSGGSRLWGWAGTLGVLTSAFILSYYALVGGWVLRYFVISLFGQLPESSENSRLLFETLIRSPLSQALGYSVFFFLTVWVVSRGIRRGIEKWNRALMILFFLLLLLMVGFALSTPGAREAFSFMFSFDWSKLTPVIILLAVGHSLFSLSLGAGNMIAYASYLSPQLSLTFASAVTSFLDTATAVLAGLAIFPIVFSFGFSPASGPGLAFITLPALFSLMPGGEFWATVFFFLLTVAGLSSAIAILEVVITHLIDEWKISRLAAVWGTGVLIYLAGLFWTRFDFALADRIAGGYLLTLGALFTSLLVGWVIKPEDITRELRWSPQSNLFALFRFLTRYFIPAILVILLVSEII